VQRGKQSQEFWQVISENFNFYSNRNRRSENQVSLNTFPRLIKLFCGNLFRQFLFGFLGHFLPVWMIIFLLRYHNWSDIFSMHITSVFVFTFFNCIFLRFLGGWAKNPLQRLEAVRKLFEMEG